MSLHHTKPEKKGVKILLDVPGKTTFGGTTTTTLTTCIGSGDDTLCRSLNANFTACCTHHQYTFERFRHGTCV